MTHFLYCAASTYSVRKHQRKKMKENLGNLIEKVKVLWSKTNRFHIVLAVFLLVELRVLPGNQTGFECGDPTLSHTFSGDTVSWKWLFGVCLLVPLAVMLITERLYHNEDNQRPKKRSLRWYKEYIFGFLINLTLVQLLKLVVGSPRPHFFDTCLPKEADTCQESEYVSSYTCTKAHWLNQSDKSFPSGHTSLAMHAGLFIVYYLHKRAPRIRPIIITQAVVAFLAIGCGLSRIWDRRHHWQDVMAGAVIAMAIIPYTTHYLCKNFRCSSNEKVTKNDTNTSAPVNSRSDS